MPKILEELMLKFQVGNSFRKSIHSVTHAGFNYINAMEELLITHFKIINLTPCF